MKLTIGPSLVLHLGSYPQSPQQVLADQIALKQALLHPARQRELDGRFLARNSLAQKRDHNPRGIVDVDRRVRGNLDVSRETARMTRFG